MSVGARVGLGVDVEVCVGVGVGVLDGVVVNVGLTSVGISCVGVVVGVTVAIMGVEVLVGGTIALCINGPRYTPRVMNRMLANMSRRLRQPIRRTKFSIIDTILGVGAEIVSSKPRV